MELLNDFNIEGINISILDCNTEYIKFRIQNNSETITTNINGTKYISKRKGLLQIQETNPFDIQFDDFKIPNNSHVDILISFNQMSVMNGDRIDLRLKNIGEFILLYESNDWYVQESLVIKGIENLLINKVQLMDSIFNKLNLSIQNISFVVSETNEINIFYELLSEDLDNDIHINLVFYNDKNQILSQDTTYIDSDEFMGFKVIDSFVSLPCCISNISRILVYPSI